MSVPFCRRAGAPMRACKAARRCQHQGASFYRQQKRRMSAGAIPGDLCAQSGDAHGGVVAVRAAAISLEGITGRTALVPMTPITSIEIRYGTSQGATV